MDIEKFINENTMLNEVHTQLFSKSRLIQLLDKYTQALQLNKHDVMVSAFYKDYFIEIDKTGYATKDSKYFFFKECDEKATGFGESIEDCKRQIDEIYEDS